uniref:Uncharacterized protein n=1 Tax=Brassica oleracea var. oleracea TaxID=109376 RepID=A0A0D3A5T5_BRAOL
MVSVSCARVMEPAAFSPSRDVATSDTSCARVRLPASLDPELRRLRACGFTIPRASNPRRRASSPPSWSATSSPSPPQYTPSSSSTSRSCGKNRRCGLRSSHDSLS